MIVLMISLAEARQLHDGKPDQALKGYLARELSLERVLPDDNLPIAVLLRDLELDATARHYVAVTRTYATAAAADKAWEDA